MMDRLDEESGSAAVEYEQCTATSLLDDTTTATAIAHGQDDEDDADNTKNKSQSDARSRSLFLQTAFWISCWYGTSLATLFLNKIILSRPGSSVHVLGMCQMTTAAVLGGWTSYGGGAWIQRQLGHIAGLLPESMQQYFHVSHSRRKESNRTEDNGSNILPDNTYRRSDSNSSS
eukprot:scaffold90542_cov49-Cyclotella_meneghiniana.AAC.1